MHIIFIKFQLYEHTCKGCKVFLRQQNLAGLGAHRMEKTKLYTSIGLYSKGSQCTDRNTIQIIVCHVYLKEFQHNTSKYHHKMASSDLGAQFKCSKGRRIRPMA